MKDDTSSFSQVAAPWRSLPFPTASCWKLIAKWLKSVKNIFERAQFTLRYFYFIVSRH